MTDRMEVTARPGTSRSVSPAEIRLAIVAVLHTDKARAMGIESAYLPTRVAEELGVVCPAYSGRGGSWESERAGRWANRVTGAATRMADAGHGVRKVTGEKYGRYRAGRGPVYWAAEVLAAREAEDKRRREEWEAGAEAREAEAAARKAAAEERRLALEERWATVRTVMAPWGVDPRRMSLEDWERLAARLADVKQEDGK